MQNPGARARDFTPRLCKFITLWPTADDACKTKCENCAAHLVCCTRKYDHVTPVLPHLHWLPVCVRQTYIVLVFAYSVMHDLAPSHLAQLLNRRQPNRQLRSVSLPLLSVPPSQTVTRFAVCSKSMKQTAGLCQDGKNTARVQNSS